MSKLKQLRDRRAEIDAQGSAIIEAYTKDDRPPTPDESAQLDGFLAERNEVEAEIAELEAIAERERGFLVVNRGSTITGGRDRVEDDPARGFKSFGDFAVSVLQSSRKGSEIDQRLTIGAAPTTVTNEGVGSEGGFLVPPEFNAQVMNDAQEGDALLPLTDNVQISGNTMGFPADEDQPWDSSGSGIRAAWEDEMDQLAQTNLDLKLKSLRLKKLTALVPITEEMIEDSSAVASYVESRAGDAIRWKTNDALLSGTGAGRPMGVNTSAGTVTVAKETSQAADTIVIENLLKMFSRCINPMQATWTANISCFPQLYDMKDNSGNRVYQTAVAGLPSGMDAMLLGRPLRFVEAAEELGDKGDIVLGQWNQYRTITKTSGISTATSVHLWFDYDVTAFKARFRIDGQPWRGTPMNPGKGSATRGHFVNLAARA